MNPVNKGGRPKFSPSTEHRNFVTVMTGAQIAQDRIASVLGISEPTLRKHFKREIANGSALLETDCIANMRRLAKGGDGTAFRANEFILQTRFGYSRYAPAPKASEPHLGKKEQQQRAAESGHEETSWAGLTH